MYYTIASKILQLEMKKEMGSPKSGITFGTRLETSSLVFIAFVQSTLIGLLCNEEAVGGGKSEAKTEVTGKKIAIAIVLVCTIFPS